MLPGLCAAFDERGDVNMPNIKVGAKLCTMERDYRGPNGKRSPVHCSPCSSPELLAFAKNYMVGRSVTKLFCGAD